MPKSPPFAISFLALLRVLAISVAAPEARNAPDPHVADGPLGRPLAAEQYAPAFAGMDLDTTVFVLWTFDDGVGGPDPQGWTSFDRTAQIDSFFHIDDFAGLNPTRFSPIQGTKSLWCGARPCEPVEVCSYLALPGYGNNWDQRFESIPFSVTGDVTIDFMMRWESEPSYDITYLEYSAGSGPWQELAEYDGFGSPASHRLATISGANHTGSVRIRFHFVSDATSSNEDGISYFRNGACIIDSLRVSDATGVVDYQDFESEPVGARATNDGHWSSRVKPGFGDYAGLFDGGTVLQEDTTTTDPTFLWGFFNGSPDTYACGGHPERSAVPFSRTVDGDVLYLHNEIRSPVVNITGVDSSQAILLAFDVYTDLPVENAIFMEYHVRCLVAGEWKSWQPYQTELYGGVAGWQLFQRNISTLIASGTSDIQVAIGVYDKCAANCGGPGYGTCHSQAPLIDNVRLMSFPEVVVVTNTNEGGPGSFDAAWGAVESTPNAGVILFDIPGPGPYKIPRHSSYPITFSRTVLIDGTSQPGYAGTPIIEFESRQTTTAPAFFQIAAPNATFRGLDIHKSPNIYVVGNGLLVSGEYFSMQGCAIRDWAIGLTIAADHSTIGGVLPGQANAFSGCTERAILVSSGTGNTIRGNSIYDAGTPDGFGIDLGPSGVTPNDFLDSDTGANNLQNFPVSYNFDPASGLLTGSLNSVPGKTYTLDFYHSPACDPTGRGEGMTYLASLDVYNPAGEASFNIVLASLPSATGVITATATDPDGNTSEFGPCVAAPLIATPAPDPPAVQPLALHPNVPNPFNPTTTIAYDVPENGTRVSLRIYDVSGRLVRTLADDIRQAGTHTAIWDGRNDRGAPASSGVYFCRMQAGAFTDTHRMVLLK